MSPEEQSPESSDLNLTVEEQDILAEYAARLFWIARNAMVAAGISDAEAGASIAGQAVRLNLPDKLWIELLRRSIAFDSANRDAMTAAGVSLS